MTPQGVECPIHVERREKALRRTQDNIEAGIEVPDLRSERYEEDESVELPSGYTEGLAETAIEQLREVIASAEVDEDTGELVISATTPEGIEIVERLHSYRELHSFIREFGFEPQNEMEEWDFGYGGPIKLSRREVDTLLAEEEAAEIFTKIKPPGTKLFRVDTGILVPEVRIELASVNAELMKFLAANPHKVYELAPRRFEELIADIFKDLGYEVLLTPRSRDGGFDVRAIQKNSVGTLLYLVECKKYAPTQTVGVDIVRGLYGVTVAEGANCGVVATTSHFTKDAKEFADKIKFQMSLRDYNDLLVWLKQYPVSRK